MNELFSREDLSEMVGREVDELSQRDLEELLEREVDLSESTMDIAARELTSYIDDVELAARADKEEGASTPAPAQMVTRLAWHVRSHSGCNANTNDEIGLSYGKRRGWPLFYAAMWGLEEAS